VFDFNLIQMSTFLRHGLSSALDFTVVVTLVTRPRPQSQTVTRFRIHTGSTEVLYSCYGSTICLVC